MGYEARPLLRISPPQSASDRRTKVFNYIQAVQTLPTNFTPDEYRSIMSRVNPSLYKKLRETFIVLDDDLEKVNVRSPAIDPNSASEVATDASGSRPLSGANLTSVGSRGRGHKRQPDSPGSHPARNKSNRT